MSWSCPVVCIDKIQPHPWADNLNLTEVQGCPVVIPRDIVPGEFCVFVPIDSVVDLTKPWFAFLASRKSKHKAEPQTTHRIKAARIRGIFSMGLVLKIPENLDNEVGCDLSTALGAIKYEEPPEGPKMGGSQAPAPDGAPGSYSASAYRTYKELLVPGEQVVITEKIHGCNARFMRTAEGFFVGSHNCWWKEDDKNLWWEVARSYGLRDVVDMDTVVYGEVFGDVQDLKYDVKGLAFRVFDIQSTKDYGFKPWNDVKEWCRLHGFDTVPLLYLGPYDHYITYHLAQGQSTLASHIREGVVIKPEPNRRCLEIGRVILKLHGEEFLLRKYGKEHH